MGRRTATGSPAGFTYVALLVWVAILGAGLAAAAQVTATLVRREKEEELLHVGAQFRQAIDRYYASNRSYPMSLEDLVLDRRSAAVRRHVRKIFVDPMTGRAEWGTVKLADGQVVGVYSLSTDAPLKKAGFGAADAAFQDKEKYSDWVFMATVSKAPQLPASAPQRRTHDAFAPKGPVEAAGKPR